MKTKAYVEGLIWETYTVKEMAFFAKHFFKKDVPLKKKDKNKNESYKKWGKRW